MPKAFVAVERLSLPGCPMLIVLGWTRFLTSPQSTCGIEARHGRPTWTDQCLAKCRRKSPSWCIATALAAHTNFADRNMEIHFFKNTAMAGGFAYVAAFGGGAYSFDALIGRRRGQA